jgi:hypothetical protein
MPHLSSLVRNHGDQLQEVEVGTETVYFQYAAGMRSRKYLEKDGPHHGGAHLPGPVGDLPRAQR